VSNCSACSKGKYGIIESGTSEAEACSDCVPGRYQTSVGANHVSLCLPCKAGKTASNKGREVDCLSCPSGWYMEISAQTSDCKECPAGKFLLKYFFFFRKKKEKI
jgi:hypothetical protein